MFKKSEEYQEIVKELNLNNVINQNAHFICYNDSMATFGVYDTDESYHEFNIICDDCFFNQMLVDELLHLDRIVFFEYAIYLDSELLGKRTWRNEKTR